MRGGGLSSLRQTGTETLSLLPLDPASASACVRLSLSRVSQREVQTGRRQWPICLVFFSVFLFGKRIHDFQETRECHATTSHCLNERRMCE